MKFLSLRQRLLLWVAGLNGLVIVVFACIIYRQRVDDLSSRIDVGLDAHARGVIALCESDNGALCLEASSSSADEPRRAVLRDFAVAAVADRHLVAGDPELLAIFAATTPPAPLSGTWFAAPAGFVRRDGNPMRALATFTHVPARPATADEPTAPEFDVLVVVAADTAPVAAELAALRRVLVLAGASVFGLSLALGVWLARAFVRPVVRLAAAARATNASVRTTMPRTGSGDELDDLAASLDDAFHRLQTALERQTLFAANASHELRTPTAVVQTAAEVALLGDDDPERLRDALRDIHAASVRMTGVIEALLVLARSGSAAFTDVFEECDLASIARQEVAALGATAADRHLEIVVDAGAVAVLRGDARLLQLLLGNLLRNAIDHSHRPGTIRVGVHQNDETIDVSVRDEGLGIPADALPHVFEHFFRVDASRNRESGGAGLGLSLVKAIAELHGASCSITSRIGQGTSVSIVFPRKRAD